MKRFDVAGKWALVTGSSRGVGKRVAMALGEMGCNIVLHSRTMAGTDSTAAALAGLGVEYHRVAAELDSVRGIESLVSQVNALLSGGIDILYNNAALMTEYRSDSIVPADDYLLSFTVNTVAPIKLCDAFLPGMLERGSGRIVNVSSGIADQPQLMAYSCSKAALDRYVRDVQPRLRGDVLINLLDPGWLRTDMGGQGAPNDPDTVIPGALVPVLIPEARGSGGWFNAQDYRSLEAAGL